MYSKVQRCEKKKLLIFSFPLVNSLHVFPWHLYFSSVPLRTRNNLFVSTCEFFNHEFKKIANFQKKNLKYFSTVLLPLYCK